MPDGEQPRCANCFHRRVFHYRYVSQGTRFSRTGAVETMVDCTRWIDDEFTRCGCPEYRPYEWVRYGG